MNSKDVYRVNTLKKYLGSIWEKTVAIKKDEENQQDNKCEQVKKQRPKGPMNGHIQN